MALAWRESATRLPRECRALGRQLTVVALHVLDQRCRDVGRLAQHVLVGRETVASDVVLARGRDGGAPHIRIVVLCQLHLPIDPLEVVLEEVDRALHASLQVWRLRGIGAHQDVVPVPNLRERLRDVSLCGIVVEYVWRSCPGKPSSGEALLAFLT